MRIANLVCCLREFDQIRHPNFEIRNSLVDLARFERATSTFAESRSPIR
jgi:hypothetical protein